MSSGPDGDDDELVDIEIELDGPPPRPDDAAGAVVGRPAPPRPPPSANLRPPLDPRETTDAEAPEIIELRQPIVEAAETDPRSDAALYESEAAASNEPSRRAALLVEVARLAETAPAADAAGAEEALSAARRAFAADPLSTAALWCLQRLLERAGRWEELADAYARASAAFGAGAPSASSAVSRAELLVERGRVYEDRLDRDEEAVASYREALAVAPDHVGALLSLLLFGTRRQEADTVGTALEGLARRADDGTRRAALVIEAARTWREVPGGEAYALAAVEEELARGGDAAPVGTLLAEMESFTTPGAAPEVAGRALERIARRAGPIDPAFAVGLWRERARLLERRSELEAALAALDEAARLDPTHPLVAAGRIELGQKLGRDEAVDAIARELVEAAPTDDQAVDAALLAAGVGLRAGRQTAAATLEAPRVAARRGARGDLRAFQLALAIRRRDGAALAEGFAAEGRAVAGDTALAGRANALAAAGALRQGVLADAPGAERLYREALSVAPAQPAALDALVALLVGGQRPAEAAEILEAALEAGAGGALEVWARATLVAIYADTLAEPARALPHQRRLVALAPDDLGRRVRLHDLELDGTLGIGEPALETLLALSEQAADAGVSVALRVEAARGLAVAPDAGSRARGLALLQELTASDATGLAASAWERAVSSSDARAEVVAAELGVAVVDAPGDTVRALRFRLAHHRASGGHYAEALAALTPLRSEGDPLARAWSYELARRSGEAILEVAVLSEELRSTDAALGAEADVLLAHAEALARAGDPGGAADIFRRVLTLVPAGPTAAEAALALHGIAAADRRPGADAVPGALRAIAAACADDAELVVAATREEALERVAAGTVEPADLERQPATPGVRVNAEIAVLQFVAGARLGNPLAIAESLRQLAIAATGDGPVPPALVPLLARAAARARLAGVEAADAVARQVWQVAHPPELAPALADLPVVANGPWPAARPDPRRARARRDGGAMGVALELEVAFDAERRGALGTALAGYGSVIAADPERLEAWTGIRRVARAGGDLLGEARALARLGALLRDPERAAALLREAADAYERAGRIDDAITALAKAVELRPGDASAYQRVYDLLRTDLGHPGRAAIFDNLLSHRLGVASLTAPARAALLYERAQHRLNRLKDREAAFADLKQILSIQPEHRESLHQLAGGAIEDRDDRGAVHWLERFLAVVTDDPRVVAARLELATAYEAVKDRGRAVETLRRAAAAQPGDPTPLQRLADLQLRAGDWRGAIEALRASEARVPEARLRAALHLRIGAVLRDLGRDPGGATASFRRAAEIDPLGDGARALVALHDAAGDAAGALDTVLGEVSGIRRALATDPLDARRLERLGEFLGMARVRGVVAPIAEAEAAVASVLALARGREGAVAPERAPFASKSGRGLFEELLRDAQSGFVAEIWPNLVEVAEALFPAPGGRDKRASAVGRGDERFGWIEPIASGLGLVDLQMFVSREARPVPVSAIAEPSPSLLFGPGAEQAPGLRFAVGRALGLLLQRGTILERAEAESLAPLYACAAVLAGASPPGGLPAPSEELLRTVTRTVSRKDRKALALQASRFGFESFDLSGWRQGVLRTADRLGLLIAGDVAAAAVALAGDARPAGGPISDSSGAAATPAARVAASRAAVDLVRFALGERYPVLRRLASGEPGDGRARSGGRGA